MKPEMMNDFENKRPLSLYIHIPFCVRKCLYCDFLSMPSDCGTREMYVQALLREIREKAKRIDAESYSVQTVFFGGGTPTVLEAEMLVRILDMIKDCYTVDPGAEVTVECNPGTIDAEGLKTLKTGGFNRLSIGLQSPEDQLLKGLGRIHDWKQFLLVYDGAREAGLDNINVDLMSALPGQSADSYADGLHKIMSLKPQPEHISAYSLILEEGTPFYEIYAQEAEEIARKGRSSRNRLPDEDQERRMYEETKRILAQFGYHRYEISNYAKAGRECRHNCVYWQGTDYLGLGLGAASYMRGRRWNNLRDIEKYNALWTKLRDDQNDPADEVFGCEPDSVQQLSIQEQMEEYMFLGLRMMNGVSVSEFECRFGKEMRHVYGRVIEEQISGALLSRDGDLLRLTDRGIDVSNQVFAEYLF